ncbi:MAG: efflux RND transporter periplasmic adaptor subunit [[Pasteurella] mairii]|nr:efflux RND transporter periplasmic adaptor subunit [[Pasteurella] mairii]
MSIQTHPKNAKRSHTFLMKGTLALIVIIFIIVIGLNMYKSAKISKVLANMGEPISPVTAMKITPQVWIPVIESTGLIRPKQGAMLSAQTSGVVAHVYVTSGQKVNKGDVLVDLDNSVEKANLAAAQAQLPTVSQTYKRYAALYKTKSISRQEMDNAKSNYDALVANIAALKATIERRQIVAPFDGITGIVKVNVGEYVTVGTEIVRVEDRRLMQVDFSLAQNELKNLHVGQKVTATTDALPGESFSATITTIEPAVNASTGLIDLQATFEPEEGKKLLSGMFTRLQVALQPETNQIVVPQVSISYNMYGEIAYILTALSAEDKTKFAGNKNVDNMYRAKQITVFTKDRQGIYAQLKGDDVKIGDIIVTGGQQNIGNGSLVIISDKQGVGTTEPTIKTNL